MSQKLVKRFRYPVSPDAWKGGIQPYDSVKGNLPAVTMTDHPSYVVLTEFVIANGSGQPLQETIKYRCVPGCRSARGQLIRMEALYYVAVNDTLVPGTWDYAISPDKLDEFIRNVRHYHAKATTLQPPPLTSSSSRRLQGARYPTSPDAWRGGVMLYPVARNQLSVNVYVPPDEYHLWLKFEFMTANKKFRIVPHVVGEPNPRVLYYLVYEVSANLTLYAVSPDQLDHFVDHAEKYLFIAAASYTTSPQAIHVGRMWEHAVRGQWRSVFRELGNSWKAAAKDPEWWLTSFAVPTTAGLAARGSKPVGSKQVDSVKLGGFAQPGNLIGNVAIIEGEVVFTVDAIILTGAQTAAEKANIVAAQMARYRLMQRAAEEAQKLGQPTFTYRGTQANPNFQSHARKLADKVGKPGSFKKTDTISDAHPNIEVTLSARLVKSKLKPPPPGNAPTPGKPPTTGKPPAK